MGFLKRTFNRRWGLYVVKHDKAVCAMHGNCVMQIIGYVMLHFEGNGTPVKPWSLHLSSNGKGIELGHQHFSSDGQNPTPLLIQQIEAIDSRWNGFSAGEIWVEDVATKKEIGISDHTPGKIDVQAMFDNISKPRELTFFSVMDEAFGRK